MTGDQIVDVNSSEVWVSIDSGADYDATVASIKDTVDRVRVASRRRHLLDAEDPGRRGAQRGREPDHGRRPRRADRLGQAADGARLRPGPGRPAPRGGAGPAARVRVDGVVDPRSSCRPRSRARDRGRPRQGAPEGIKPGDVRRAEATLLQGIQVGSVFEDQKVFDVIVQGTPSVRAAAWRASATC